MAKVVVRNRRKVYAINELTQHEKWDMIWMDRLAKWKEFVHNNGHQRIPLEPESPRFTPELGFIARWANTQRVQARKGMLKDWRFKQLKEAGFLFEPQDTYWNRKYEELVKYKNIYGHSNVPKQDAEYSKLGKWVGEQRFHKKRLTKKRIDLLNELEFDWGIKRNKWDEMYGWLKEYYKEHGISNVQRDMKQGYKGNSLNRLNRWCCKQIWYYNRNMLSKDKILLLNNINFNFNHKETIIENEWELNFNKMLEFKSKNGHCRVPVNYEDRLLYYWVHRQRTKRGKLPEDKQKRLNDIGFVWHWEEYIWDKNYNLLKQYYDKNGSIKEIPANSPLNEWVRYIRKVKKGRFIQKLTEEQIRLLKELNFDWAPGRGGHNKKKPEKNKDTSDDH